MILFISDVHFAQRDAPAAYAAERAKEAALLACLRAHAAEAEALYLVGDIFDEYIEYRTLVPKGFVRFQALLAEWTDRGVPVTYLVGNHDPWHRDYFARELGVEVVYDALRRRLHGLDAYLWHGDGLPGASPTYRRLKPFLRHPLPVALYKALLPSDLGFRLARGVNRRVSDAAPDAATVEAVRAHARHVLTTTGAALAVLGHSHQAEHTRWPEGTYLNPGSWARERTFGTLRNGEITLLRWNGDRAVPVDPKPASG